MRTYFDRSTMAISYWDSQDRHWLFHDIKRHRKLSSAMMRAQRPWGTMTAKVESDNSAMMVEYRGSKGWLWRVCNDVELLRQARLLKVGQKAKKSQRKPRLTTMRSKIDVWLATTKDDSDASETNIKLTTTKVGFICPIPTTNRGEQRLTKVHPKLTMSH